MGQIIIVLVYGIIMGFATQAIIENKGYNDNWFWWGFFFGIIALIVAAARPQCVSSIEMNLCRLPHSPLYRAPRLRTQSSGALRQ